MAKLYSVKPTGRTWGVFHGARLVEGGFFSLDAALAACADWNAMVVR